MAKKTYTSIWMELDPEDPTIVIGASQGTIGDVSVYSFADDIPAQIRSLIELNCDYFDLQDMDTDGNRSITMAEFQAWYDATQPW